MRKLDESALLRAVEATGGMPSLVRVTVEAYLDGVQASKLKHNPRLARLAAMRVGDRIEGFKLSARRDGQYKYLQTADVKRARVLMNDPAAMWRVAKVGSKLLVQRIR